MNGWASRAMRLVLPTTTNTTNGHGNRNCNAHHYHNHNHNSPHQLQLDPQTIKYIAIASAVLMMIALFSGSGESSSASSDKESYKSLIDEAPLELSHLVLIGERHLGIPWMQTELKQCFQDDESSQKHKTCKEVSASMAATQ